MDSTSTSATGPSPRVLEELQALFSWSPPKLIPGSSRSTKTRPPSFYDKHFTEDLVLKSVKRLPSLVEDLARNVDTVLGALTTLPPLDGLITARQREDDLMSMDEFVPDEKAVTNYYQQTTAKYCSQVASTLSLCPTAQFSRWRSLLSWTQSGPSSGYAIMDGKLCFIGEGAGQSKVFRAALLDSMDSKTRRIFKELRDSKSSLASWEFKSTDAGPVEVITTVPKFGKFSWTYCSATDWKQNRKHEEAGKKVNLARVIRPDALSPPWSLSVC
jgi:hypothetical protein